MDDKQQQTDDVEHAKKVLEEQAEKKRVADRKLTRPHHFHATIFCFVTKGESGSYIDTQHNEVMGLSPDSCIRKALSRSERRQTNYHLQQLTECHDGAHTSGMED